MMRLLSVLHLALGAAAQVSPGGRGGTDAGRGGRGGRPDYSHLPVSHEPSAAPSLRCVCAAPTAIEGRALANAHLTAVACRCRCADPHYHVPAVFDPALRVRVRACRRPTCALTAPGCAAQLNTRLRLPLRSSETGNPFAPTTPDDHNPQTVALAFGVCIKDPRVDNVNDNPDTKFDERQIYNFLPHYMKLVCNADGSLSKLTYTDAQCMGPEQNDQVVTRTLLQAM